MKTLFDLAGFVRNGGRPVVTFKGLIEELDTYAEPGMRARFVGVRDSHDGIVKLEADFSEFDAHNRTLERANYYDAAGNATLTARESGNYEPREVLYFAGDDDFIAYMAVESDATQVLHAEFLAVNSGGEPTYTQWLERELLKARCAAPAP